MTFSGGNVAVLRPWGVSIPYNAATTVIQILCNGLSFKYLDVSGNPSSFGTSGTVSLGNASSCDEVIYTGAGGSTDRPWVLGGNGNQTVIHNNGSGAINFNNTGTMTPQRR